MVRTLVMALAGRGRRTRSEASACAVSRSHRFRHVLLRGGICITLLAAFLAATGPSAAAQSPPVPFSKRKPAGADRGVLLNVVPEKSLQPAPPAGAIYNFGSVDRFFRPILRHTFTLRNVGKVPVSIDHIQSSCGCTTALLLANGRESTGYKLQPGRQVAIRTAVDTSKLSPGLIKKFLWVMMPGETVPSFVIRLDAKIEGALTFSPPVVEFGRVDAGAVARKPLGVTLDSRLISTVGGVRLVSSNSGVIISPETPVDTPVGGGDGHTVSRQYTISISPKIGLGVLSATLSFVPMRSAREANRANTRLASETATTLLNAMSVVVTGEVFGQVSARPGTVVFGAITEGEAVTRRITLVGKTQAALRNLKVVSGSAWVSARLTVPDPGKSNAAAPAALPPMLLLEVTLNPKTPAGAFQTTLELTTEAGELLILPVFGYVTPAVKQ